VDEIQLESLKFFPVQSIQSSLHIYSTTYLQSDSQHKFSLKYLQLCILQLLSIYSMGALSPFASDHTSLFYCPHSLTLSFFFIAPMPLRRKIKHVSNVNGNVKKSVKRGKNIHNSVVGYRHIFIRVPDLIREFCYSQSLQECIHW
jgi:hypothetical protein